MAGTDSEVRIAGRFYKYRDFPPDSDRERWEWLEDTLLRRRVFFASPRTLNDPFDCYPRIDIPADEAEMRRCATKLLIEVHTGRGQTITDKIQGSEVFQSDLDQLIIDLKNDEFRNKTLYETIDASTGVYCMSRTDRSVLQWSYYAGGHTGLCLEYSVPTDARPPFDQVVPMEYVADREGVNLFDVIGSNNQNYIWRIVRKKYREWSHECEVRAFMPTAGTFELQPHVLTGIIFGSKATEGHKQRARELAERGWSQVTYYQARRSFTHYDVDVEMLT